jgi:hypothetical protein
MIQCVLSSTYELHFVFLFRESCTPYYLNSEKNVYFVSNHKNTALTSRFCFTSIIKIREAHYYETNFAANLNLAYIIHKI